MRLRHACLLSVPPISPAARQTVSSTIKGCAVMKGALAEAIYFPAQCRKVSLVLIFHRGLCVLHSPIIAGETGRDEEDTRWLNKKGGWGGGIKAEQHHISFKNQSHLHVFTVCLCFSCDFSSLRLRFLPFFFIGFSCLLVPVFHLCLSLRSLVHTHLSLPSPPIRYSRVHFVPLKFIELVQTAEAQKIREARSLLLPVKWYCTVDE